MSTVSVPPAPTPWRRIMAIGVGLAAIVAVVVLAFSWPSTTAKVQDLPLSISGPAAQVSQVEKALDASAPGSFSFVSADDRGDAVAQIKDRTTYGAVVLGDSPEVLTSSAASTITNQLLTSIAPKLQAQLTQAAHAAGVPATQVVEVKLTDVVPLASTDPRGSGLTAAAFPLTLGGMLGGLAASLLIVGAWRRVAAVSAYVVVAGLALGGILQGWFGVLQGNYFVNAAAITLTLLAISATIVGVTSLVGRIGSLVGPVVFLLIANPISSATQPLQFLPQPWGQVGQWFPPGAGNTLLRDLSYFPDAGTVFPWLVVAGWSALGVALALIGHFRQGIKVDLVQEQLPAAEARHSHPAHSTEPAHDRHPAHVA
ncbi:membrane protein [Frondihabitans sucicola]|uniref:Membrane protein n=1 Tax=Frondihabitans sucicola TaxID=1268041 RepID=A0ABM8GNP5_9MICO|nr:ABC transporter permease [Frondihabitans sucicola]BDZ50070.1 membrane protein [Frondihabitans sucicola]